MNTRLSLNPLIIPDVRHVGIQEMDSYMYQTVSGHTMADHGEISRSFLMRFRGDSLMTRNVELDEVD